MPMRERRRYAQEQYVSKRSAYGHARAQEKGPVSLRPLDGVGAPRNLEGGRGAPQPRLAKPGRSERWGALGAMSGPPCSNVQTAARCGRGNRRRPSRWGRRYWGAGGAPAGGATFPIESPGSSMYSSAPAATVGGSTGSARRLDMAGWRLDSQVGGSTWSALGGLRLDNHGRRLDGFDRWRRLESAPAPRAGARARRTRSGRSSPTDSR